MVLDEIKNFKLEIQKANVPLSLKYEYLDSLNSILDEYSFFALQKLREKFNFEVAAFNQKVDFVFMYLKKRGNFLTLKESLVYDFLKENIGVLFFMSGDFRAIDIVKELELERNKDLDISNIDEHYILRLYELTCHLKKYGDLPVQTDRNFKFADGTYMGTFLAHNKKKIRLLKEGNEYAYEISRYYEKKYMSFNEKLKETYTYLTLHGNLPFIGDTKVKFSNGDIMSYFLNVNRKKLSSIDDYMARAIIQCLDGRIFRFEQKVNELYTYLLKNNLTKNSVFSNGSLMIEFIYENKKRLEQENNDKVKFILNYWNQRNLSNEDKVKEAYLFLQVNGFLPSKSNRKFSFSDGSYLGYWIYAHYDEIKQMGDEYSKVIINYICKTKLTFEDKLDEIYNYLLNYNELPSDKNIKFSNGEIMMYFLKHNRKKIESLNDEKSLLIKKYWEGFQKLSFADKVREFYAICLNDIQITSDSKFSDGVNIKKWLHDNKRRLKQIDDDNFKNILINFFGNTFEEKVVEAYNYICENESIPFQSNKDIKFSDGSYMGMWFANNKRKIYYSDDEIVVLLKNKLLEVRSSFFDKIVLNDKVKSLKLMRS